MGNELHFGDNLDVLRAMPVRSVDLIYLDPPFNSQASYNVLYGTKRGGPSQAQAHTFGDTWTWGIPARRAIEQTAQRHLKAGALLDAFRSVFPESNMLAYLAMMAVRLIEMHRVLKDTGSIYLHCDPTASHYLKVLMDAIFGTRNFKNEISWKRTSAHNSAKRYGPTHDTILFYTMSDNYTWNVQYGPYDQQYIDAFFTHKDESGQRWRRTDLTGPGTRQGDSGHPWKGFDPTQRGRHWQPASYFYDKYTEITGDSLAQYDLITRLDKLDEIGLIHWPNKAGGMPQGKRLFKDALGIPLQDVWTDIRVMHSLDADRLGFSTQKPMELLKRIIGASSNEGDRVLDPFCGCGTAIEAAELLNREWVGIDVTYLAIHVIEKRLVDAFKEEIKERYRLFGSPMDAHDASALAGRDWLEFQKWAVLVLGGLPLEKPGPDGGIDGIIRYHRVGIEQPNRAVVSVKGGRNVGVDAIHKLKSVVTREKAELGVLVCLEPPTAAMVNEATSEGDVGPPSRRVPKLQIVTVEMLFGSSSPVELPGTLDPPEIGRPSLPSPPQPTRRRRQQQLEGQTELLLPAPGAADSGRRTVRGRAIRDVQIEVTRPTFDRKTK